MDDDELTFGQWLQRRRKALHLTQQQLGGLARCAAETIRFGSAHSCEQARVPTVRPRYCSKPGGLAETADAPIRRQLAQVECSM